MSRIFTSQASSPNSTTESASLGYRVRMSSERASAACFAGVIRVLAVEDHRVAHVDQEHRRARGEVFRLEDLEVVLGQPEPLVSPFAALPAHRVSHAREEVDVRDGIAEDIGGASR